jgi:hypothetical protein
MPPESRFGMRGKWPPLPIVPEEAAAMAPPPFFRPTDAVTLLTPTPDEKACEELDKAGVARLSARVAAIEHGQGTLTVTVADGGCLGFDTLYPVLVCEVRSELNLRFANLTAEQRRSVEVHLKSFWSVDPMVIGEDRIQALGGVDTYRIHRTMAARVTMAR